ncbi:MAG: hypothetical protein PWP08_1451 [Methanofollis sp.]|nr:hypothetical protein [Methanofollis sp.]
MLPDQDEDCRQIRILHMDNDPVLSRDIRSFSENNCFSVVSCNSEQEALELLKKDSFDIVVAEHRPPDMDGVALLRVVRLISPHLPFIFFTNNRDESLPIDALNAGADYYIRKGGDQKSGYCDLQEKISHAVRKREGKWDQRENIGQFRCIAEHCTDLILVTDWHGHIIYVSPSSMAVLGYMPEEFPGAVSNDDIVCMTRDGDEGREGAHNAGREIRARRKDGSYAVLDVRDSPVYFDGVFQGTLVIARDVTHTRTVEQTLRKVNKKLAHLSSVTRHDILNQVAVLVGYLELLQDDLQDRQEVLDVLKIIETATRKIEQQITFTREYEGLGMEEPGWQNIEEIVANALRHLKTEGANVVVSTGTLEVYADPMLWKAISSLFDNTVRHAGTFTEITVTFRSEGEEGCLTIGDNGAGIPDALKERIFARGYGSHAGFGLDLVREILEITGLSIREVGEAGKGACFEIRLPAETWRC